MTKLNMPDEQLLTRFAAITGERHALRDEEGMAPYLVEWRDKFTGKAALVLRPANVQEVSKILALAHETRTGIVPQGGNTGLVGGQIPDMSGAQIIVSLARLNHIRNVDAENNSMIVEAGCILEHIQTRAEEAGRFFPLSLASEGSCQIGGNLSSNAGGTGVLAYGTARELVLGLEVVLADGRIWNGLRSLRKDNTGYDLKALFLGAEGTLGIITAAALKLYPCPARLETALLAVPDLKAALRLLHDLGDMGGTLSTFEIMPRMGIEFVLRHIPGVRDPFEAVHEWYVLAEVSGGSAGLRDAFEQVLMNDIEGGIVIDAVLAENQTQREEFWRLRHGLSEAQKPEGGSIKHDISVPVSRMPEFIDRASAAVKAFIPGCRPVPFGHMGDGNVHFNVSQPVDMEREAFLNQWEAMNAIVHDIVTQMNGSISAEHGIGILKRDLLPGVKSTVELDMMRSLKSTFDPHGILNPGKLIPEEG
ncbi:MAG TPA: FAD-binding oxidoreductase, partial [Rhizobiales bacterium]|nr:FAD-binding oxidoreductase [Hyphomicrobiales bacterium]